MKTVRIRFKGSVHPNYTKTYVPLPTSHTDSTPGQRIEISDSEPPACIVTITLLHLKKSNAMCRPREQCADYSC